MSHEMQKDSLVTTLKKEWYLLVLILATLILGLLLYPQLPDKIPSHWNFQGEIDGWTSKPFGVFFFPLLNLGLYLLLIFLPRIDPRRENYRRFTGAYRFIRIFLHLFLAALYVITLLVSVGYPLKVNFLVKFGISLLLLLLGNYMGKIKHNYFVGIKTPWTLASEEVWYKTHRFAGPLWVAGGALGMITSFLKGTIAGYLMFGIFIFIVLLPTVYSYLLYRRIMK